MASITITITITLDDAQMRLLARLAERRGQTIEAAAHDLLERFLTEERAVQPIAGASGATLTLAGAIDDPTIRPLTARDVG